MAAKFSYESAKRRRAAYTDKMRIHQVVYCTRHAVDLDPGKECLKRSAADRFPAVSSPRRFGQNTIVRPLLTLFEKYRARRRYAGNA